MSHLRFVSLPAIVIPIIFITKLNFYYKLKLLANVKFLCQGRICTYFISTPNCMQLYAILRP